MLGDEGADSADNWLWGGNAKDNRDEQNIHLMVMAFGKDQGILDAFYAELEDEFRQNGMSIITKLTAAFVTTAWSASGSGTV